MKKILVSSSHFDTLCTEAGELIRRAGYEIIYDPHRAFPAYITREIENMPERCDIAAALIGMDDYTDEGKFKAMPGLRAVAKFGVGVDNIDLSLAKKYKVKVINAPGQNSNAVAELTVAYMIALLRNIISLHESMQQGEWPRYIGDEIDGKTVGLLGFGAIARLVAEKLRPMGARVIAYDLYPNSEEAKRLGVELVSLEELILGADIVSLHIPATKDNYHLFDARMLEKMKPGAYLVNAARGALVDLDALAEAILSGHIAGAAIDAFENEPLNKGSEILKCKNIILTPHTGGETKEAYYRVSMSCVKDILRVLNNEEPLHCVN